MTAFTCQLIGWGALLVECAEVLVARGHRVTGMVTRYPPAREWASERGITVVERLSELDDERPDYLFSVTNDVVLRPDDLARPRRMAINLHSSPLPKYAGVHQTTWALLHGETEHGVTWHEMVAEVDAGRVLVQRRFPIEPDDTTLALDVRCHEHALSAFEELLDGLRDGTLTPVPQDPAARSYFSARRLFPGGGLVTGNQTAAELDRWCRAGEFGRFDNRFGRPRLVLGTEAFLVTGLRALPGAGDAAPGTVLSVHDEVVRMSTADGAVEVTGLQTVDGDSVAPGEAFTAMGVSERLPEPPGSAFLSWFERWAPRESRWLDTLTACTGPAEAPIRPLWLPSPVTRRTTLIRPSVLTGLRERGLDPAAALVTAWTTCLGDRFGTVRFSDDHRREAVAGLEVLVTRDVPLPVAPAPELGFPAAVNRVASTLAEMSDAGTYLRDVPARYPLHDLRDRPMPVALAATTGGTRLDPAPGTAVTVTLDLATPAFHIAATDHLGPPRETVRAFANTARSVLAFVEAVADRPSTPLGALR
ncbi:formyltransferase family protein [Saccharomonospora glauca]|uniref:Methionyl-tRNA formyltransferase n=1 Tax=Saccharomonospora glauca K62 TaxID=928724 RepID=I1D2G4_9PSEU|nr:formyltransferase family protein [Saccharomonospora glauca]EIE99138.1 methionyl-tRNA formyltransferase [Saccharomonospora glauca K62]